MVSRDTKKRMSRWLHAVNQRLLGIIFILFFAFFFLGPPFAPSAYWIMTMVVLGMLVLNGIRIASGLVITSVQVKRYVRTDWTAKCAEHDRAVVDAAAAAEAAAGDAETSAAADGASAVPVDSTAVVVAGEDDAAKTAPSLTYAQVRHLIVVPNYKEELETLIETLDTLANHKMARTHYKVCICVALSVSLSSSF